MDESKTNEIEAGEAEAGETPTPYGFDLDPGEEITRVIHRHPLTLVPTILGTLALVFVAGALSYAEGRYPNTIPFPPLMVTVLVLIILVIAGLVFLVGLIVFQRNVLIFTSVHLVMAEQHGLFGHRVSQVHFTRIQDVTGVKRGFIQTIFNFGLVEIQSAGEKTRFDFYGAPDPQELADEALEIHESMLARLGMREPAE
jgi:membrane protein YdbS with pleckstrin-like domain